MKYVKVEYSVSFGKGDSTDWIEREILLTDEEEQTYTGTIRSMIALGDVMELDGALRRARAEIEADEIRASIDNEEEYVLECQGLAEMDPEEINDLVEARDPHTLAFFGLEDENEDTLDLWDANDLEELPLIKDFVEDFEPYSPYDEGWNLTVRFVDPNYC